MRFGKLVTLAFLALATALSPKAGAQHSVPDPLSGRYEGVFKTESMGDTTATLELKNENGKVTGSMESSQGSATLNGTFAGGKLALKFFLGGHGAEGGNITALLDNDKITGTWDGGVHPGGTVELKRVSGAAARPASARHQYAPYEFLLGEWDIAPEGGGPAVGIQRVKWGPNRSYLWCAASLLDNGVEQPHFEGILAWNGVHKNLSLLLSVDLQYGLAEEQGTLSVEPDGTLVRDITAVYSEGVKPIGQAVVGPDGATGHFRQTFKAAGPDKILTSVMRESEHGWVATFPGSDHMVMTRRSNG